MASSLTHLLSIIVVVFLGLLSISANARPCKTLLISSYSISFKPTTTSSATFHRQNPNFFFLDKPFPSVPNQQQPQPEGAFVTIFTSSSSSVSRRFFIDRPNFPRRPSVNDDFPQFRQFRPTRVEEDDASFGMFNSLRDRTKDVLSVVVALLFGVGCGALTAGTMYLAFSIIKAFYHPRRFNNYYDDSDSEDEEDDVSTPKKVGYVKIPSAEATPAKQVDIAIPPSGNKN